MSQVRSLAQAEEYVREAIAFVTGATPDSFAVTVVPQLPAALADRVAAAKQAAADAEQAQATAASLSRAVVAELAEAGFNGRESAVILGLSKQRISQLAATSDRPRPRRVTRQKVLAPRTPTDPDTATATRQRRAPPLPGVRCRAAGSTRAGRSLSGPGDLGCGAHTRTGVVVRPRTHRRHPDK